MKLKTPFRLLFPLLLACTARADLCLPALISDHAMLQAGKPVAIWGWASPDATVTVAFVPAKAFPRAPEAFTTRADGAGKWSGHLAPLASGAAGRLDVSSDRDPPRTVSDIVVGEVWLGGGQSNMVYDIAGTQGGDPANPREQLAIKQNVARARREAAAVPLPIRYFEVAKLGFDHPADDVDGHWVRAAPDNVPSFSAVAWNFALELQVRLRAPVGLIVSCVGGSHIETWMPRATILATSVGPADLARYDELYAGMLRKVRLAHEKDLQAWYAANPTAELQRKNQSTLPGLITTATFRSLPARLYNGMIRGLEPYTLRGVIWFQADGNNGNALEYGELFRALIRKWRADWGEQLPFYFVEMNNMLTDGQTRPVEPHNLCLIREQQHAGLEEPGVGMVAAIDLGIKNPHFPDKKPVGQRLARLALGECYHLPLGEVRSPLFRGYEIVGSRVRLAFTDAGGLRVRGGGELKGFAIRGATGDWVWADGRIEGRDIVVWSPAVPAPAAVRYAWAPNPTISVENAAGLPLYPFRTDTNSRE